MAVNLKCNLWREQVWLGYDLGENGRQDTTAYNATVQNNVQQFSKGVGVFRWSVFQGELRLSCSR